MIDRLRSGIWALLLAGLLASLGPWACAVQAAPFKPTAGQGTYLVLSDIHFDPFTEPGLARKLEAAALQDWPAILRKHATSAFASFGNDSNYALMAAALDAAAALGQSYDFVLVVGDLISHDFQQNAQAALGSAGAARAFATKTSRFVANQIETRFRGVPVIPAIGNNDGNCGDYGIEPDGSYLQQLSGAWRVFKDNAAAAKAFAQSGSYVLPHPTVPKHRLIVVDSVYLSMDYKDACRPQDADPGQATLDWLSRQLADARGAGDKASLVMHIPPGFDGYASAGTGSSCRTAVPLWKPNFQNRFRALADGHKKVLTGGIAGHLHTDGFRVFGIEAGEPYLPIHITPSISPVYYNNPAFTVFLYDRKTAANVDFAVFFTQLDAASPTRTWSREYRFSAAYDLGRVSANSLASLSRRVEPGKPFAAKFKANFQVRAEQSISSTLWRSYLCAQTSATEDAFVACRCTP